MLILRVVVGAAVLAGGIVLAGAADVFSIHDAIKEAVRTNPGVSEASANRRATEAELRQAQGVLLPQVRLDASAGPEKLKRYVLPQPTDNGVYQRGREASIVIRQTLFDGFASINEIWRQAARVDAAALRVLERTELIALDATEAYIDMVRYQRLVALAEENLKVHFGVRENVRARFRGGRAGEGDNQQAEERVASAQAVLEEFRLSLETARAKYRKVVGIEPYNLRFPGRLSGLPRSKDESLAIAVRYNPTIRAAQADVDAAKHAFNATAGAFVPQVSLEGRATRGADSVLYSGQYDEVSGKVVMSWDIFRGGQDSWKRKEAAERMIEETQKHARLQRDAVEALDKAWAARTITTDRVAALAREVEAARRTYAAYNKEYELGQRTLIDTLNAQNQFFNAEVSLVSARGTAVFADYQLLAAMGHLLSFLKTAPPPEVDVLETKPFGFVPIKFPPIILSAPAPGPEPLNATGARPDWLDSFLPSNQQAVLSAWDPWPKTGPRATATAEDYMTNSLHR
ncbi:TolC family outer membrane protein [Bradyrhizobium sp. U87765 SZCCT0131]|uniref:TolC family outer membrane protein n=1 Tax=unclassified Bradyrhizobium TaxID=2631580 RepID=UPI001BAAD731|nr:MULTISPECIES: TolC family outer membrane protein [unclassified Bradyrhizobium]MBR1219460.1 TolC family outer membrane protein [Bradyrhizobium sp. U87765 SZCCT0131]MBR1262111.1 TolC family outer membrane protein [Bradyrhizobium sp. U87765 SZCCT0134]MBR1306036.1 TolC family outer membrane protein [Bradyrhizobium sp. U87765 SZCCT0110]MBR1317893.1 TolC family outer membrane protein [Bradyrhizobium sp. U87765 SZCCT0109]MBR1351595.1 TolC family outer membrane protein [Bradyrhizobium sp. U87765 SZ